MVGIAGRGNKIEVLIKALRLVAFRMHGKAPDARGPGSLKRAQHRVLKEAGASAYST